MASMQKKTSGQLTLFALRPDQIFCPQAKR